MADPHFQFRVNPSSGVPIYRQIEEQVRALIAGGRLEVGSFLPSVRKVAQGLAVNPMTVSKAYARLEAAKVLERVRGQGMRVLELGDEGDGKAEQLEVLIEAVALRGRQLGLSDAKITGAIRDYLKRSKS